MGPYFNTTSSALSAASPALLMVQSWRGFPEGGINLGLPFHEGGLGLSGTSVGFSAVARVALTRTLIGCPIGRAGHVGFPGEPCLTIQQLRTDKKMNIREQNADLDGLRLGRDTRSFMMTTNHLIP